MLLCMIYGTDVIVPIHMLFHGYFFFNSGMENRILSQICGRLYFPIFLLRVGLFTLMYIDSLMVLARLFFSLPIILKLFSVVSWPWSRKISKFPKIDLVRYHKNGRIKADDFETGAISKHGLKLKIIKIMLDGCLNEIVF